MTNKRHLAANVIAALVVIAVIALLISLIHEADHDCTGESCPVCAAIAFCQNTLKILGGALISSAAVFSCACTVGSLLSISVKKTYNKTPVSLKVKLLD